MSLHPDYPVVTGHYRITRDWEVVLPDEFNRRIEDEDLVLWRPALTFWIAAWNNDARESKDERLRSLLQSADVDRSDEQIEHAENLIRVTYEVSEEDPTRRQPIYKCISGHVFSESGELQISAHFDTPAARTIGYRVIHSVTNVT